MDGKLRSIVGHSGWCIGAKVFAEIWSSINQWPFKRLGDGTYLSYDVPAAFEIKCCKLERPEIDHNCLRG